MLQGVAELFVLAGYRISSLGTMANSTAEPLDSLLWAKSCLENASRCVNFSKASYRCINRD